MADVISYPFDPTGQAPSNRIIGEQIIITAPGDRRYHFTMPKFAPMFEEGLVVKIRGADGVVSELIKGRDYYLGHQFKDASAATMHELWGSITFLRRDIVGVLIVDYNTLGDIWTVDAQKIIEILANQLRNPRTTTWEQVVERPVDFPVIDHPWNVLDMVGMSAVVDVLERFYQAYLVNIGGGGGEGGGGAALLAHINDRTNVHKTTANQTGAYSYAQIDLMFQSYLKTNATATDSARIGGKTLAAVMLDVVTTKVNNAVRADTAGKADTATKATDSDRVGGKTVQEIVSQISTEVGGNAVKFDGKTYPEAKADILTGTAADSGKLGGKTLNEIITQILQSTGDAKTLEGRNYAKIMLDVVSVKVNNAANADNASKLGNKSILELMQDVIATEVNRAKKAGDADKVYNLSFNELVDAIIKSPTYYNLLEYQALNIFPSRYEIQSPNDGGNLDPNFTYTLIGEFMVPGTNEPPAYDPQVETFSSSFDIFLYWKNSTNRLRVDATSNNGAFTGQSSFKYYSDNLPPGKVQLGIRIMDSPYISAGGVRAKYSQIWMKFNKADDLRRFGIFQYQKNSFVFRNPDLYPNFWDHTSVGVGAVVWQPAQVVGADLTEVQKAFDDLADAITILVATPAA